MSQPLQLTILMPCLNEAETIARCVETARIGLERAGVRGEILIADNGSTDGSQAIAEKLGARVVAIAEKGYGNALRGGIIAARGEWIIMGDADASYDFAESDRFVKKFQEGYELVMGCRLPAGAEPFCPARCRGKTVGSAIPFSPPLAAFFSNVPRMIFIPACAVLPSPPS